MKILSRGFILSLIPIVEFLCHALSWHNPIVKSGSLHIGLIFCILLIFSWIFLKNSDVKSGQAVTYPFKILVSSVLIFLLFALLIVGILTGFQGIVQQLPRIVTYTLLYFIKGLIPSILVAIISYVLHSRKKKGHL